MNKYKIRKAAEAVAVQIGDITYTNIVKYIEFLGYEVRYDKNDILNVAAAVDFGEHTVFVSTKLSEEISIKLLAYEIAHIVLKHSQIFNNTTQQEMEAEYFAKCLLNYCRNKVIKTAVAIGGLLVWIKMRGVPMGALNKKNNLALLEQNKVDTKVKI